MSSSGGRPTQVTLAGVPLAIGLMIAAPPVFVIARILGRAAAFLIQRTSPVKALYNVSAYGFEAALAAASTGLLIGYGRPLDLTVAVVLVPLLAAGDQRMSLLVLGVIRMHNGQLSHCDSIGVLLRAGVLSLMATSLAVVLVPLMRDGALGLVLIVAIVVALAFGYRGYVSMSRRHNSLSLVHDFVTGGVGAESVESLGEQWLTRIRGLLRAESAELVLFDPTGDSHPGVPAGRAGSEKLTTTLILSIGPNCSGSDCCCAVGIVLRMARWRFGDGPYLRRDRPGQ
jgi:hypothetical protein